MFFFPEIFHELFSLANGDEFISEFSSFFEVEVGCGDIHLEFESFDVGCEFFLGFGTASKHFGFFLRYADILDRRYDGCRRDAVFRVVGFLNGTTTIGLADGIFHGNRD